MQQMLTETEKLEIIEHEWAKARAKNPEVIMRVHVQDETDESGKPRVNVVIAFSGTLGIDKKMSKEELIQFEGLVIEILPDARYHVQLDAGYEVLAYTVALLRWEPARLASKQSFPVDFREEFNMNAKPARRRWSCYRKSNYNNRNACT